MTVSTEWFDELDGENQESGSIDTYIDVDGGGIQFNTDQISSSTFDGGIPSSTPSNTTVALLKRGDYAFWNLTTGSPVTVSAGSDIDGDIDFTDDYVDNMYLVVDIETDDTLADPDSSTATRYIYLQDEEDVKRVSATGSSSVTIIRESEDISEWDAGSTGWLLTSSGNAIFGSIYARGAIYAESGDIEGNLSFGGSLIGTSPSGDVVGVAIYGNNPQISASNYTGVINAIGTNYQTAFDANDIQTFSYASTNTNTLRIQRIGGDLELGSTGSTTTVKGDLDVDGTLTATTFNPTSINTGAVTASDIISATGGSRFRGPNALAGEPTFSFNNDTNTGMYRADTNLIGFSTGGVKRFEIGSGQVTSNVLFSSEQAAYIYDSTQTGWVLRVRNTNSSQDNTSTPYNAILRIEAAKTAQDNSYRLISAYADNSSGFPSEKFQVLGNGRVRGDLAYESPTADYAEYFEWEDGNPDNEDRVGYAVSLIDGKIKICDIGENPIGVISATPSVIGNSPWSNWKNKYLQDDFGRYILEDIELWEWEEDEQTYSYYSNQIPLELIVPENKRIINQKTRILNPEFNESLEYLDRGDRKEWGVVGLIGQIRLRKGQIVSESWIKLGDISETVELWLVK